MRSLPLWISPFNGHGDATVLTNVVDDALRPFLVGEVIDDDRGACLCKRSGYRLTNPGTGPCDQRTLLGQILRHGLSFIYGG